jgi:hypothetical protein
VIKTLVTTALAIILVGTIGFALRLWLLKHSFEEFNTTITNATAKSMNQLKATTGKIGLPTNLAQPGSDLQHPKANPQDWDSISNSQQICWIHKQTHKKICEQKS